MGPLVMRAAGQWYYCLSMWHVARSGSAEASVALMQVEFALVSLIQLVAIIPSRSMACFTIALIVHKSGDELLHRHCLKKGR